MQEFVIVFYDICNHNKNMKTIKSRLYHIYDGYNRILKPEENLYPKTGNNSKTQ